MVDRRQYPSTQNMMQDLTSQARAQGAAAPTYPSASAGQPWQQTGRAAPPAGGMGGGAPVNDPTVPLTGFASQYSGLPLWETIYDQPQAILPDVFPGIDPMGQGYNMLADLPFDPGLMYYMTQGSQAGTMGSGVDEYTNWLAQMYQGVGGGGWFDFGSLMNDLMGAGDGSELQFILENLPPGEAANVLQGMLGAAATVGLNPLAARAMGNVIPGMFAGMTNNAIKTNPADQGRGFNDPMDYLRTGLASIGMGF